MLIGMGVDGIEGVIDLKKNKDVFILVELEEMVVIYGMFKLVVFIKFVDYIELLWNVGSFIFCYV